ncbi:MAG: PorT family protein [Chlorobi bacterium]|nr:PorT family protein [Chlorobiota bacterium]
MKKIILSIIFGIVFGLVSLSQSTKHNIGIFAGSGLSNNSSFLNGIGYDFGVLYSYSFNERFAIITGLDYDSRNSIANINFTDTLGSDIKWEVNHKFDFISLPVLFNVKFGNKIKYYGNVGFSTNYLVRNNLMVDYGDKIENTSNIEYYKRFEIDINLGVGGLIPLSEKFDLMAELRYKKGLNNLSKNRIDGATATTETMLFLVGLNYKL